MKLVKITKKDLIENIKDHKKTSKTSLAEELVLSKELQGVTNPVYADALDNFENTKEIIETEKKEKDKEIKELSDDTATEESKSRIKVPSSKGLKAMKLAENFLKATCDEKDITLVEDSYQVKVSNRKTLHSLVENAKQNNLKYDVSRLNENNYRYLFTLKVSKSSLNEWIDSSKENARVIKTGLTHELDYEVLESVMGQLSDGIWENSAGVQKYWKNSNIEWKDGEVLIVVEGKGFHGNPFYGKTDEEIMKYFATKIKQVFLEEKKDGADITWERDSKQKLDYMNDSVTVGDCYRVYDHLLGRKSRSESPEKIKLIDLQDLKAGDNIEGKVVKAITPSTDSHYKALEGRDPYWFDIEFEDGTKELHFSKHQKLRSLSEAVENEDLKESVDPRRATNDLISAVQDGFVTWEDVAIACLKYMSEDAVKDMCRLNDFHIADDDQLEESIQDDKDAISHYEVDLPTLMHSAEDLYMEGKLSARAYANCLRQAYSLFEDLLDRFVTEDKLTESRPDKEEFLNLNSKRKTKLQKRIDASELSLDDAIKEVETKWGKTEPGSAEYLIKWLNDDNTSKLNESVELKEAEDEELNEADSVREEIEKAGKSEAFDELIKEMFPDGAEKETIDNLLVDEKDWLYSILNINSEE